MNQIDFQNPLFIHRSKGLGSLAIQEKLTGAQIYCSWRRSIEIALSTKRKTGFITGTVVRPVDDEARAEQWDTCNNMVISWVMSSVSDQIAKFVIFIGTSVEIWKQLEKHFTLSNGSRKIVNLTPEIVAFMAAYDQQKEEQHLFQFLNGLDENYSTLRSQLLLMNPLPSVEIACSMLQQEESQREMFTNLETTALYSKTQKLGQTRQIGNFGQNNQVGQFNQPNHPDKCATCGHKWHSPDKCWEIVGYPVWHYKYKSERLKQSKMLKSVNKHTTTHVKGNNVIFTSEQFEQLLKSLPQMTHNDAQTNEDSDGEIEHHFAAGILSNLSTIND
ncbi:uncharacterized protein [Rutidosis leptorrhynchoides]|uniref:uncharacterized protein n=1 Tax=Rutidosis leptorrhynchoides TaxID=125765 RepID=UPI003A99C73F